MNNLEKKLAIKFNKKYCVFTGNGTTSMYLILKSLNLKNKKIIYPAITCMTPVNAAIYAGYEPVFCDVNLKNYTMDIESLKSILKEDEVGVIVPTHIYGHRCDINAINGLIKDKRIFILEDAAQSYYFSEYANASIISFGHTKLLQCDGGGGAIFTDDINLYNEILKNKLTLPDKRIDIEMKFNMYRDAYYDITKNYKDKEFNLNMKQLQLDSKETFIYDLAYNKNLFQIIENFNNMVNERIEKRRIYDKYMLTEKLKLPKLNTGEGLWRYTFLYNGDRNKLLKLIRKKNIDVSSWYPSLDTIYKNSTKELINAKYLEDHIVNLWVDHTHTEQQIKDEIKIINQIMNEV